jgi:hypothetical protein
MRSAPDSTHICAPDSFGASAIALDSWGVLAIGIGAATDFFCAAKAAEGASPRTVEWYRMILIRAVRRFGDQRPIDAITAAELRAWLLELRSSLAPESIAGYVRGLKAFGNWCVAEELAEALGFRALRRPHVPRRLIAPFSESRSGSGQPAGSRPGDRPGRGGRRPRGLGPRRRPRTRRSRRGRAYPARPRPAGVDLTR